MSGGLPADPPDYTEVGGTREDYEAAIRLSQPDFEVSPPDYSHLSPTMQQVRVDEDRLAKDLEAQHEWCRIMEPEW